MKLSMNVAARLMTLLMLALGLGAGAVSAKTAAAPQGGTVTVADGIVLTVGTQGQIMPTGPGGHLNPGEQILTAASSRAIVQFPDGGQLVLASWSHVALTAYAWDGNTGENAMRVKMGPVRWTGGKLPPGSVTIQTPGTETTTEGTEIVMIVFPDGTSHQGVWDGGTKVRNLDDGKTYTLPKGAGATFKKTAAPQQMNGGPAPNPSNSPSQQLNGYQNWDQATINGYMQALNDYLNNVASMPTYAQNHDLFDWMTIWYDGQNIEGLKASAKKNKDNTPAPKGLTTNQYNGNAPQFYDDTYKKELFDVINAINDMLSGSKINKTQNGYKIDLAILQQKKKALLKVVNEIYPNNMELFPESYDYAPKKA